MRLCRPSGERMIWLQCFGTVRHHDSWCTFTSVTVPAVPMLNRPGWTQLLLGEHLNGGADGREDHVD